MDVSVLCDGDDDVGLMSCAEMNVEADVAAGNVSVTCLRETACDLMHIDIGSEESQLALTMFVCVLVESSVL